LGALAAALLLASAPSASAQGALSHVAAGVNVIFPSGVLAGEAIDLDVPAEGAPVTRTTAIKIQVPPGASYGVALPRRIQVAGRPVDLSAPLAGELVVGQHELALGATIAPDGHLPPGRYVAQIDVTLLNN